MFVNKHAELSNCRKYRYALWRTWNDKKGKVLFIGLNPSTADETIDDTTITRCIRYATQWGYGGVIMGNLFAYRTPSPEEMKREKDPVGPDNDSWLKKLKEEADIVVAIWGNAGCHLGRSDKVAEMFPKMMCLRLTAKGQPHHTRGLPNGLQPIPYKK